MRQFLNRNGMTMVAILISLFILGIMAFTLLRAAPRKPAGSVRGFAEDAGIDTSSQLGILESSKKLINEAEATRAYDPTADMK